MKLQEIIMDNREREYRYEKVLRVFLNSLHKIELRLRVLFNLRNIAVCEELLCGNFAYQLIDLMWHEASFSL